MTSRFVHVVRCKAMNSDGSLDDSKYADVEVIDMVCITDDNGGQETFDFTAANAVPTIVDVAGDGGGIDNGGAATRQSRLRRVTSPVDSTQFFNEEVLDRICVTRNGGAQEIWDFSQVSAFIEATTGPDLGAGDIVDDTDNTLVSDQGNATRLIEVDEVLPDNASQPPPQSDGTNYMAVADMQQVCVTINGSQSVFNFSDGNRDITDTTQYTTDSSGNPAPPDNSDPDPYVVIPEDSSGLSTGNALVQQGPLWKIVNFSSSTSDNNFALAGFFLNTVRFEPSKIAVIALIDGMTGTVTWADQYDNSDNDINVMAFPAMSRKNIVAFWVIRGSPPNIGEVRTLDVKGNPLVTIGGITIGPGTAAALNFDGAKNVYVGYSTVADASAGNVFAINAQTGKVIFPAEPYSVFNVFPLGSDLLIGDSNGVTRITGGGFDAQGNLIPITVLWNNNLGGSNVCADKNGFVWATPGSGIFALDPNDGTVVFSGGSGQYGLVAPDGHGNVFAMRSMPAFGVSLDLFVDGFTSQAGTIVGRFSGFGTINIPNPTVVDVVDPGNHWSSIFNLGVTRDAVAVTCQIGPVQVGDTGDPNFYPIESYQFSMFGYDSRTLSPTWNNKAVLTQIDDPFLGFPITLTGPPYNWQTLGGNYCI